MQYNSVLKEIAVIKACAATRNGCTWAFLNELLPRDTGLEEVVYELAICFDKKPTQHMHFRKAENAVAYLDEYLAQHAPHKEFRFWNRTGLED